MIKSRVLGDSESGGKPAFLTDLPPLAAHSRLSTTLEISSKNPQNLSVLADV
jgi:hypothetical protein